MFCTKSKQSFLWRVHDWQCVLRWGPPGGQFYSASPPTFQAQSWSCGRLRWLHPIWQDLPQWRTPIRQNYTSPSLGWRTYPYSIAATNNAVRRDNSDHLMLHLRTRLLHRTDLYPRCREIIAWELNMLNRRYVYCILRMSSASTRYDLHQPLNQVDSLDCIWSWKETDRRAARPTSPPYLPAVDSWWSRTRHLLESCCCWSNHQLAVCCGLIDALVPAFLEVTQLPQK